MDLQSASEFLLKQRVTFLINRYEYVLSGAASQAGALVAFAEQKRLTLKEEINVYTSVEKTQILFSVKAEKVLDVHGKFFVRDQDGNTIGYLRKVFGKSLIRSTWDVYDATDQLLFTARETSQLFAAFRRVAELLPIIDVVASFIPYHFEFVRGTEVIGAHRRRIGLFDHYDTSLNSSAHSLDRRLVLALGIALDALQAR